MSDLYRKVWAPDGTAYEVPPEKASDLVLNHGWSNTAPQKKTTKKTSKKVTEEAVPAADTTEAQEPRDEAAADKDE